MPFLLQLAAIVLLALVAWQDFRFRAVTWVFFPLLFILSFTNTAFELGYAEAFFAWSINTAFLVFNLLFVFLYLSISRRSVVNFTGEFFGWGDILFLVAVGALVSPANFIIFFIASLFLVVILALLFSKLRNSIPLAGLQAIFLLPVFIVNWFSANSLFHNQQWLDSLFN